MEDKKRYNYMENALQNINKSYISLPDDEVKRNNQILENILQQIIGKMKEKSELFKKSFTRVFYGGSYYDGLRVGNPEEFDLDLLLTLPKYAEPDLTNSNIPGFVHLQLKEYDKWAKQPEAHQWVGLSKLLDDKHYLVTSKVSAWIEGLVKKALNEFPQSGNSTIFNTSSGQFKGTIHKGGPAHTLKLEGIVNGKKVVMDVDLVPCFVFTKDKWPSSPYRPNPVSNKPEFFIVPKKPGSNGNVDRYWRLSFQEQERELMNGSRTLKPTIKLLKKLRDNQDHKAIASYFIKTVLLWEVTDNRGLWNESLSYVFMFMLKKYKQFLENREIPYYWNRNNNLLKANDITLQNFANRIQYIIDDIERPPEDPFCLAKYLVHDSKLLEKLKSETVIGKKQLKKLQQLSISDKPTGTPTSLLPQTNNSSSTEVDSIFFQTKPHIFSMMTDIVNKHFDQNPPIKITSSLNSETQFQAQASVFQNLNQPACNVNENVATSKIDKLQASLDKVFALMENLSTKIDCINENIAELRQENRIFKNKLQAMERNIFI
ncbi:hypothetical protein ILUMI_05774 [Ignelater luminosus]|uniref:Uncharacterized protein n=1 Tax=Ignelater luminosus TaxID=2038154 RepID=A0A8K0DCD6_IGNLU|nr:hypothetical protein ILUMI_05774 [Ignelater luminosus]